MLYAVTNDRCRLGPTPLGRGGHGGGGRRGHLGPGANPPDPFMRRTLKATAGDGCAPDGTPGSGTARCVPQVLGKGLHRSSAQRSRLPWALKQRVPTPPGPMVCGPAAGRPLWPCLPRSQLFCPGPARSCLFQGGPLTAVPTCSPAGSDPLCLLPGRPFVESSCVLGSAWG